MIIISRLYKWWCVILKVIILKHTFPMCVYIYIYFSLLKIIVFSVSIIIHGFFFFENLLFIFVTTSSDSYMNFEKKKTTNDDGN